MTTRKRFFVILVSIIVVNTLGFILLKNKLDDYIILAGFRFHICFILPFIILLITTKLSSTKKHFVKPAWNKTLFPLIWIFLPFVVLLSTLYLMGSINIGDPDYFYEFGLSSIFDLPVYLIWNLPGLILFAVFLTSVQLDKKREILITSFVVILLFAYRFIPFGKERIDYNGIATLIFTAFSAGIILKYFRNIYWFGIIFFMMFWLNLLAFGSSSQPMIHLLFASEYKSWDGFFEITKKYQSYLLPAQAFITFISLAVSTLFAKNKNYV